MALSLAKGKRVTLSKVDAFADGVAVKQVGAHCLAEPCALVAVLAGPCMGVTPSKCARIARRL
jgi:threonine dehydratase